MSTVGGGVGLSEDLRRVGLFHYRQRRKVRTQDPYAVPDEVRGTEIAEKYNPRKQQSDL
jgi:hypothetical protein